MATKSENLNLSPGFIRRLLRENRAQGRALASHELRRALEELQNPELFELKIDFHNTASARDVELPSIIVDPVSKLLPRLNVPIGAIVWEENADKLPVVGILTSASDSEALRAGLKALLTAHASDPFARFVFLCTSFAAIPFLGRYQFAYEYIGENYGDVSFKRAAIRYGFEEVRSLVGAELQWKHTHN
ncbi:hypothetical protein [Cognatishimia activa]|uniref:Uncharacterized protein n=1 Tax=Cognatishimia activa TaxID=1715691 RepID=A0A0P1IVA6_9RHOB|nr:hypothetical protein [Cognatishimia activa]CUJ17977.1 hypothetical protein TA5113_02549 [Cognatishimia activa]CUK27582.1 hypothetical protein TA5114_03410 [Cognatishimia activa]